MSDFDPADDPPSPPADILQSWKEIAAYLDATERSAQRWEQLEGLPVHRQVRSKRSAVYAYKSEIERWRRARSTPPAAAPPEEEAEQRSAPSIAPSPPGRTRALWPFAAGAACLAAALFYWAGRSPAPTPLEIRTADPLVALPGSISSPAIAPDASRAAFAWKKPGKSDFDLAILERGSGQPTLLRSGPEQETAPAWSRDGSHLAYCRVAAGGSSRLADLVVIDANGDNERLLARVRLPPRFTPWSFGHYFAWMPDGEAVVSPPTERGAGLGLARVNLATGETEILTDPGPGAFDTAPAISPDGRLMAFLRSSTPIQTDIYVVDLTAQERIPVQLTAEGDWAGPPAFLPDSATVLATTGRLGGVRRLVMLDAAGDRPPTELAGVPPSLYGVSVSADGLQATAFQGELEVNLYRALVGDGPAKIEKLLDRPGAQGLPALSPDGSQLAFESFGGAQPEGVWIMDASGANPRLLTDRVGMLGGPPAWSPDGQRLAVAAADSDGQHLYVIEAGNGAVTQISSGPERAFPPRWTRDGSALTAAIGGPEGVPRPHRIVYPSGEIQSQSEANAVMVETMQGGGFAVVDGARDLYVKRRAEQELVGRLYWRHTFEVRRGGVLFLRHNGPGKAPTAEAYHPRLAELRVLAELPGAWRGFTVSDDRSTIYFDRQESETTGLQWLTLER